VSVLYRRDPGKRQHERQLCEPGCWTRACRARAPGEVAELGWERAWAGWQPKAARVLRLFASGETTMRLSPVPCLTVALCLVSLLPGGLGLCIHSSCIVVRMKVLPEDWSSLPLSLRAWPPNGPAALAFAAWNFLPRDRPCGGSSPSSFSVLKGTGIQQCWLGNTA